MFRFDSGAGKFANRVIRGIRDSWVTGNDLTVTITSYAASLHLYTGAEPGTYSDPIAAGDALGNYLAIVRDSTSLYTPHPTAVNEPWAEYTFDNVQFRHVTRRDTGRRNIVAKGRQASYS